MKKGKYQYNIYWIVSSIKNKIDFFLKKKMYYARNSIKQGYEYINSAKGLLPIVIKQVLFGVLTVVPLRIIDHYVGIEFRKSELYFNYSEFFNFLSINNSIFIDVLIGSISIAGIFLSLFYTSLTSIFASRYANAPISLNAIFQKELIATKHVNKIIRYITIALLLCLLSSLGIKHDFFLISFMFIFTISIIISFNTLGRKIYDYSDYYKIASSQFYDMRKSISDVAEGGLHWSDKNFQAHNNKTCTNYINTLSELSQFGLDDNPIKTRSMLSFIENVLLVIRYYLSKKNNIPHDSLWFNKRRTFPSWFTTSDHEIQIALRTGTDVNPKDEIDVYWFEDKLFGIIDKCLNRMIENKDITSIQDYLLLLCNTIDGFASSNGAQYVLERISKIDDIVSDYITGNALMNNNQDMALSLYDTISYIYIEYILKCSNYISHFEIDSIVLTCTHKKFSLKALLQINKSFMNNGTITQLFKAIRNELKIEQKQVTPNWYIVQAIAKEQYNETIKYLNLMSKVYKEKILVSANRYSAEKAYKQAMIFVTRENELFHKLEASIDTVEKIIEQLEATHIEKSDKWSLYSIATLRDDIRKCHTESPKLWFDSLISYFLDGSKKESSQPDIAGFCYFNYCDHIMNSISNTDFDAFKRLYSKIIAMTNAAVEGIIFETKNYTKDWSDPLINLRITPYLDYMNLSGYAILSGEILDDPRWCELVLDVLTSLEKLGHEKLDEFITRLIAVGQIKDNLSPAIYNKDIIYTDWELRFYRAINGKLKFKDDEPFHQQQIDSKSKLINSLYYSSFGRFFVPAKDIFLVIMVNPLVTDDDKKFRSKSRFESKLSQEED